MLSQTLTTAAKRHGSRTAFVTPQGEPMSYAELEDAVAQTARGLADAGVGDGSVVGLVLDSGLDYVAVYLAAARIGAVTAGVNTALTAPEVARCLHTLQPDLVITSTARADLAATAMPTGRQPAKGALPAPVVIDATAPSGTPRGAGGALRRPGAIPEAPRDDHRPVCVCFTSGTTGTPKGAWFTSRQLTAVAEMDTGGAWGGGGHSVASTHFAHVGFMTKLPWMLATGQTTHILQRWSAAPVLELTARHRISAIAGVAPQIALMVRHPLAQELDFSSVKAVVAGGAPSPPELVRAARACFDAPYSIRYSSTESGGVGLATALDADDTEAFFTVGRPRPGVQAQIRTTEGATHAHPGQGGEPTEVGELWLRSPATMSGYWRNPAATSAALDNDGWLRTGDLAWVDEAGLFRLAGRTSEMYIRGGYNVYPAEVEAVLADIPGVTEVAVVAHPHDVMGQIGVAVVVPARGAEPPTLEALRDFGASSLARHKLPEALVLMDALPRNTSHKIDRGRISAQVQSTLDPQPQ